MDGRRRDAQVQDSERFWDRFQTIRCKAAGAPTAPFERPDGMAVWVSAEEAERLAGSGSSPRRTHLPMSGRLANAPLPLELEARKWSIAGRAPESEEVGRATGRVEDRATAKPSGARYPVMQQRQMLAPRAF